MSLSKLTVELAKGAIKTYTVFPATPILGFLIDTVTTQENATRNALEQIQGMVSDMQENPLRVGKNFLQKANRVKNADLKRDRIIKAQDEFVKASNWRTALDPLLTLKAGFFAGVCDDLLDEPEAAIDAYEEVFKKAKELERLVPSSSSYDKDFLDRVDDVLDFFSFPGDYIEEWFEKRDKKHKAKKELLDLLFQKRNELKSLLENLLTIITKRKGVSKAEYLKPWAPQKRKWLFGDTGSFFWRQPQIGGGTPSVGNRPVSTGRAPFQSGPLTVCSTCNTLRKLGTCPKCRGTGKTPMDQRYPNGLKVNCTRCFGSGRTYVCQCDPPVLGSRAAFGQTAGKKCMVCRGTGRLRDGAKCFLCKGTGISRT